MVVRMVPEQKYVVFEHRGSLKTLGQTYQNIYQAWLPQSGLQMAASFDMEVYTDEFKDFTPDDSGFYIYVPVK
jgi:AraC family transcriptional regulator